MAFPTTDVLTGFDGANEEPLSEGGAWSASTIRTAVNRAPCRLLSNAAAPPSTATSAGESVWATSFDADQEIFCDVPAFPVGGINIYARIQNEGTASVVAYLVSCVSENIRFFRLSNTTFTQIGTASTQAFTAGDSIGLRVSGTTLEAWFKDSGGSWTLLIDEEDANVSGAGKIGIGLVAGSATSVDNFGGGTVVAGASEGPLFPGTVTTETGPSGDNDWLNAGNVSADDGSLAEITAATFDAGDVSFRLKAQNFGFAIPAGATIDGIIVEIERSNAAGGASDNEVRLYDSTATLAGDNKAVAGDWAAGLTLATYGGAADTWNAGLDATDINDADFGVAFIVNADVNNTDIGVDFIRVTVHYTAVAATHELASDLALTAQIDSAMSLTQRMATAVDLTAQIDAALSRIAYLVADLGLTADVTSDLQRIAQLTADLGLTGQIDSVLRQTHRVAAELGLTAQIDSILSATQRMAADLALTGQIDSDLTVIGQAKQFASDLGLTFGVTSDIRVIARMQAELALLVALESDLTIISAATGRTRTLLGVGL